MVTTNVPEHVPADLVRDYDYTALNEEEDLYLQFKRLHDGPDFFYTLHNEGHWVATRYADMDAILGNYQDFSNYHASLPKNPFPLPLLETDPPLHTDYRKLIAPFFTPKYVGNLEKNVRDLTISLIEGFRRDGECEFMHDFAYKMPIIIVMSLLDLPPEDREELMPLANDMVRGDKPEVLATALGKLGTYVAQKVIPARRLKPGNDIFSALLQGNVEGGRPLSDHELINIGCLVIAGGLDTVASMLGFIVMFLARNRGHREQLQARPERIKHALEELTRRHHIANMSRVVIRDMNYRRFALKAGDVIFLPTTIAGLDEQRYPDPFTVDFDRADTRHLVFSKGPHQCVGSFLARTELRIFASEWLQRIPHFEIKAGEQPKVSPGKICGMRYLPLTWQA